MKWIVTLWAALIGVAVMGQSTVRRAPNLATLQSQPPSAVNPTVFVEGLNGGFFTWNAFSVVATNAVDRIAYPYGSATGRYLRQVAMGGTLDFDSTADLTFLDLNDFSLDGQTVFLQGVQRLDLVSADLYLSANTNLTILTPQMNTWDPSSVLLTNRLLTLVDPTNGYWEAVSLDELRGGAGITASKLTKWSAAKQLQSTDVDIADVSTIVDSVAALVALDPTERTAVRTLGYHAPSDNGGGVFRRVLASSGATNTGTFFASTANATYAWERVKNGDAINVRWFGAAGDGVTDDTSAVQAAVAYQQEFGDDGPYFPRGVYLISSTINSGGAPIHLRGDGNAASGTNQSRIVMTSDNTPIVNLAGSLDTVDELTLAFNTTQPATNTAAAGLVFANGAYKAVVSKVTVSKGAYGFYSATGQTSWNHAIRDCYVTDYSVSGCYLGASGTESIIDNLYVQNLGNQVAITGAITNVTRAFGTNYTFYCESLPPLLNTNRLVSVTGLSSGFNGSYVVTSVSGATFTADASSDPGVDPVDVTGTVAFVAQPAVGPSFYLGAGWHGAIHGLNVEHVVIGGAGRVIEIRSPSVSIDGLHMEALYSDLGEFTGIFHFGGALDIGVVSLVNSGVLPGQTFKTFSEASPDGLFQVGGISTRDIAYNGGTWTLGATTTQNILLNRRVSDTTVRANASSVPTSDGAVVSVDDYVLRSGDTITGDLILSTADGTDFLTFTRPAVGASTTFDFGSGRLNVTTSGGLMTLQSTESASAAKEARVGPLSYNTAHLPFYAINMLAQNTGNILQLGGGSSVGAAAQRIDFVTTPSVGDSNLVAVATIGVDGEFTARAGTFSDALTVEGDDVLSAPASATLTTSGGAVTISGGGRKVRRLSWAADGDANLVFTNTVDGDTGTLLVRAASTNVTLTLTDSFAYSTSGSTLTVTGGTNNWSVVAWEARTINSTNVVLVNLGDYSR